MLVSFPYKVSFSTKIDARWNPMLNHFLKGVIIFISFSILEFIFTLKENNDMGKRYGIKLDIVSFQVLLSRHNNYLIGFCCAQYNIISKTKH